MNPWSNIEVTPDDHEVSEIDLFESKLGKIPVQVLRIRELITRFEVCHFKYKQHLENILGSIPNLKTNIDLSIIGVNHIRHGDCAWINDKTGRSFTGQKYLRVLQNWVGEMNLHHIQEFGDRKLEYKIRKWLGQKDPDKKRIVRLLIARLTYDWEAYNKLQRGGKFKDIEYHACRMDICHYSFPGNLDELLKAIGKKKVVRSPEGCGSFNPERKRFLTEMFSEICFRILKIKKREMDKSLITSDRLRLWLLACLAKTIKAQIGLPDLLQKLPG